MQQCPVEKKLEIKGIWDRVAFYLAIFSIGVNAIGGLLYWITGEIGFANDGVLIGVFGMMGLLVCWVKKEVFG